MSRKRLFAALLALSWIALPRSEAATIQYTSASAFAAAATGLTSYGFPAPLYPTFQNVSNPYTVGPVSFSNVDENYLVRYGYTNPYLEMTAGDSDLFAVNPGATALSFDLATYGAPVTFSLSVNGTNVGTWGTTKATTPTFLGLVSTTPITSVRLTAPSSVTLDVLDFQVGSAASGTTPAPVPEPLPLSLVGTGVLGIVAAARRRLAEH